MSKQVEFIYGVRVISQDRSEKEKRRPPWRC